MMFKETIRDEIDKLVGKWLASEYEIHKQPPYRAHSFDDDGRYWVVGTSDVSVLQGAHGSEEWAAAWAKALNDAPAVRARLEQEKG